MTRPRSRIAAVFATFAAVAVLVTAPAATADTTTSRYHAMADATALNLQVFGQGITLGLAHADVADAPTANGHGTGALLPGATAVTDENYTATTEGVLGTATIPTCGPITLPADFPVVDLATACAEGHAAITGGLPTGSASGTVATLDVNAQELAPVTDAVKAPIGQAIDGLKPIFDALDNADIDADTLIKDILSAITEDGDIVRASLGAATSASGATADTVSATSAAQGAVIEVLPRDGLELDPVMTIEVGASSATIDVNRASGQPTTTFDPALVRVTLADDIAATLPDTIPNPIEIAPGV